MNRGDGVLSKYDICRRRLLPLLLAIIISAALIHVIPDDAAGGAGTDYIVKYKESADRLAGGEPFDVVSEKEMIRLRDAGLLAWYEPDGEMTLLDSGSSIYYADDKWDLALVNAEPAFEMGALGEGVRVGVLDSGVNPVPCIADNILPGRSYIEGKDEEDTSDNYGHGTLVAALIAGRGEDGYIGAAPGAEIIPLKITDGKAVTVSAVCRAIYGGIDDFDCDVLNLSLGVNSDFEALREAVEYAAEKGVVVVAAVGNNGTVGRMYPAEYESVIGVGAVDQNGTVYYNSNHNESVFLTAPGANVKTAGKSGGYVTASGTSFSVPFVTAAAAVMRGLDPQLTPDDIASILTETARDAGPEGWDDYYGYGILDLGACAERIAGTADAFTHETPCEFLSAFTLVNYTDEEINCTYLLAEYDGYGTCLSVSRSQFTVPAQGRMRVEPPESKYYGQFVFETGTMTPLATARKSL